MKKLFSLHLTSSVVILFLLFSCTITSRRERKVEANVSMDTLTDRLRRLVDFEYLSLQGYDIKKNIKSSAEMQVELVNIKNMPYEEDQIKALAKAVAVILKTNVKDSQEFKTYNVAFVKRKSSGGSSEIAAINITFNYEEL